MKKLHIKVGNSLRLMQAPEAFEAELMPLPENVTIQYSGNALCDVLLLFVRDRADLVASLPQAMACLRADSVFWVIYPKKSSGITTDLEMQKSWDEMDVYQYEGVAAAAINSTWTALRFKPTTQVKRSENCNESIEQGPHAVFIDIQNRTTTLPPDLHAAMHQQAAAVHFFDSLSFSNRKEYLMWILTAKQEKTRTERIAKTVEKLLSGKKNPAEK